MQDNATGRAEAQISARGKNIKAIRSPKHCKTYRHLRSEATDNDRDGIGTR